MTNPISDPFDELLGLEDNFYREGYDAGIADGESAGLVEGRVFGIEKGYEKALELGKMHGRALVWQIRSQRTGNNSQPLQHAGNDTSSTSAVVNTLYSSTLPKNARLAKHIEGLLSTTDTTSLATDNSDEAVTEFDDHISRGKAKAKVIAAIANEPLSLEATTSISTGIEESMGLNARH